MEQRSSYPPASSFMRSEETRRADLARFDTPEPQAPPPPPRLMGRAKLALAVLLALGVVLVGAWAGVVAYAGSRYGYAIDSAPAWQQTTHRTELHLVPGAVALLAGLVLLLGMRGLRRGRRRLLTGLAALLIMAAGAWLVLGRAALAAFTGSASVGTIPGSHTQAFLLSLGYELGPGIVLLVFGAWSLGLQAVGRAKP